MSTGNTAMLLVTEASFSLKTEALYQTIDKAAASADSNDRTTADYELHGQGSGTADSVTATRLAPFLELFDKEIARLVTHVQSHSELHEHKARDLLSTLDTYATGNRTVSEDTKTSSFYAQAHELTQGSLALQKFLLTQEQTLKDIANHADNVLGLGTYCSTILQRQLFYHADKQESSGTRLLAILSDVYDCIRAMEHSTTSSPDAQWKAPSSFQRSTTKYWVKPGLHLRAALLTAIQEVPLLVYGQKGRLTASLDDPGKCFETETLISSVYLDCPDKTNKTKYMCLYKERISRFEGAQLLRARWYGGKRPEGSQAIFLELKTHHEKWINCQSVKERVTIRAQDMKSFLSLSQQSEWTIQKAQALVLSATPKLTGQELEKAVSLLLRMRKLVVQHKLRPCVRSAYTRTAFQSPHSNDLRITVDRNVRLYDETTELHGDDKNEWCLPDHALTEWQGIAEVPFAILEVKLAGNRNATPSSLQNLIDEGTVQEAAKFSKFLSGAATFQAVDTLPYWASHEDFASMFCQTSEISQEHNRKPCDSNAITRRFLSLGRTPKLPASVTDLTKGCSATEGGSSLSSSAAESKNAGLFSIFQFRSKNTQMEAKRVAPKQRARVEPKSYFANERTFIQWISAALLLVTIAAILLDKDDDLINSIAVYLTGGAVVVICYASFVYFRRVNMLSHGQPYGYIDHVGPGLLAAAALLGVVVLTVYLMDGTTDTRQSEAAYLYEERGQCHLHSSDGIVSLAYEPSDIAIDSERGLLLVPSLHSIKAHSMGDTAPVKTLVDIPNEDMEGLTYASDGRLFALSEYNEGKVPALIELAWENSYGEVSLKVVQRWELPIALQNEGIAYVPGITQNQTGHLYTDRDGDIVVYDLPKPLALQEVEVNGEEPRDGLTTSSKLVLRETIRKNRIGEGLADTKISGIYYFEGLLYVLHDNAKVIRAWKLSSATLVAEIPLPRVGGNGGNLQWEGIALHRGGPMTNEGGTGLRGTSSSTSSLVVHLALDTPAQIWSFVVQEEATATGEGFQFPLCAGANH